jgi:hypothetical protein
VAVRQKLLSHRGNFAIRHQVSVTPFLLFIASLFCPS